MDQMRLYEIVLNYSAYLLTGLVLLGVFFVVYTRITPHEEHAHVRDGNTAVAVFLSGAMIGFTATIASCILTHVDYLSFIGWVLSALFVQVLVQVVMNRLIPGLRQALESNNVAVGTLGGAAALCAGLINAAAVF